MSIGLNLYSIRNKISTPEEFLSTANRLRDMGYSHLQFSGAPFNAEMIAKVSRESGLPITLTHVPMGRIIDDTDRLMDEHALFGCKNIGLGAMPLDAIKNEALFKSTVESLNRAGEKMSRNGFKFFYHHHHFEFFKHQGQTAFDYMIENAPFINFTADTYWLQYGGVSITEFLERLAGRIECIHLKDYTIALTSDVTGFSPRFCPVGDGTINFQSVIDAAKASGAKHFLVEQDNAADFEDPFEQVQRSVDYIKKELVL